MDVGESVSRVGGKAQLPAYRAVAGDLRLAYSQFEELEVFSRFGTHLEKETRHQLERGRRVREILKQPRNAPMPVAEQIIALLAVTEGLFDELSLAEIRSAEKDLRKVVRDRLPGLTPDIEAGVELDEETRSKLLALARDVLGISEEEANGSNP